MFPGLFLFWTPRYSSRILVARAPNFGSSTIPHMATVVYRGFFIYGAGSENRTRMPSLPNWWTAIVLYRQLGARLRNTLCAGTHQHGARPEAPPPELGVFLGRRRDYIPSPYFLMSQNARARPARIQNQQPIGMLDVIFVGF